MASQAISLDALPAYVQSFESIADDIPLDGFFSRAKVAVKAATMNCFDTGTDPNGNPWPALKHQRVGGSGNPAPLRDTDHLMASVTAESGQDGSIREQGPTWLRWGTSLPYANIHQYGGTILPKHGKFLCIPATEEAQYVGSPTRFPRPLVPHINKAGTGGVLVEVLLGRKKKQFGPINNPFRQKPLKLDPPKVPKPKKERLKKYGPLTKKDAKEEQKLADNQVVQFYMTVKVVVDPRPYLGFSAILADKLLLILDDWLLGSQGVITKTFFKDVH